MRKILLSTALASTLFMGACSSLGTLPVEIQTAVTQTQAIARAICAFEPTAATIGAVAASLFPGGGAIDTVANGVAAAICAAVAGTPVPTTPVPVSITASSARGGAARGVSINGVPIEGRFSSKARKAKMINGVVLNGNFTK
jgi:hypothetical protein